MSEETVTLITVLRHINRVQFYLNKFISELQTRLIEHDISKLTLDEFATAVAVNKVVRDNPFGSDEYNQSLVDNKEIFYKHFAKNSHHPEHYKNGVSDMSIFDIIEMVIDWKAAGDTYGQTSFEDSLEIQRERFGLDDCHMYLINLIAKSLFREDKCQI